MFSVWKSWLQQLRHPSDEDLVALADGEVSTHAARKVRRHLHNCWSCRMRAERIQAAINAFMRHRAELYGEEASGKPDWGDFTARLARVSTHSVAAAGRESAWWGGAKWAPVAAAGVLAAVIWLSLASAPAASARTVLVRAHEAERALAGRLADPVLHRKLAIERRSRRTGRRERAAVDYWHHAASGRSTAEGGETLWRELATLLGCDRGGAPPLSVANFEGWWSAAQATRDAVRRVLLADGSLGLEIRVHRLVSGGDGIVENWLVLREGGWEPVRQRLWVRVAGDVVEYDLRAEAFDLVAYALAASHFAPAPEAPRTTLRSAPAPAPAQAAPPLESLPLSKPVGADTLLAAEVEARFALHRLQACMGEPVEVERDKAKGRIVVKGLVPDDERRRQIAAALAPIEHVTVRLTTVGEALQSSLPGAAVEPGGGVEFEQVRSSGLGVERLLPSEGPERIAGRDLVELANRVVGASSSALLHAFALERLAEAFPAETVARMKPAGRWLLETIARAHAGEIHSETMRLNEALAPVFRAVPEDESSPAVSDSEEPWRAAAHVLVERLRKADRLVKVLFTASPPAGADPLEAVSRLRRELSRSGRQARRIEARIPGEFGDAVASLPGDDSEKGNRR